MTIRDDSSNARRVVKYVSRSQDDTVSVGGEIARSIVPGDVVLLYGEMGAGKSVVARSIARGLGVTVTMPSPTFPIMLAYDSNVGRLYHYDLFRLNDEDEFHASGLGEYIGGENVCLIEWPDGFEVCFEAARRMIKINIDYDDDDRIITKTLGER